LSEKFGPAGGLLDLRDLVIGDGAHLSVAGDVSPIETVSALFPCADIVLI